MRDYRVVQWGKHVDKQLHSVPVYIAKKFYTWVKAVEFVGVRAVRKTPGFHDEPLAGNRKGERSIRLNKAYRAIYRECASGTIEFLEVTEVMNHEY